MFDRLCSTCKTKMPYSVLCRPKKTLEWKFFAESIEGKDNAYTAMKEGRAGLPHGGADMEWYVIPRNAANALMYGIRLGKLITDPNCGEETDEERRKKRKKKPLHHMPDHI